MLCEKCQAKPALVHIQQMVRGTGEALSTPIEHHFCEDCGRDFIKSNPDLKTGTWSKPTLEFKLDATANPKSKPQPPGEHGER